MVVMKVLRACQLSEEEDSEVVSSNPNVLYLDGKEGKVAKWGTPKKSNSVFNLELEFQ